MLEPDSHCRIRELGGRVPKALAARAAQRWQTASRVHYNLDLRFNSQSIIVGVTDLPSLGGRAWPTVLLNDPDTECAFALWCNSTFGLLCHWWMSNRTQEGRGTSTVTSIPGFATLDLRRLTREQRARARVAFDTLRPQRFLPFDQIDEDGARATLDRVLVEDVLGLPSSVCDSGGPLERLRAKNRAGAARPFGQKDSYILYPHRRGSPLQVINSGDSGRYTFISNRPLVDEGSTVDAKEK